MTPLALAGVLTIAYAIARSIIGQVVAHRERMLQAVLDADAARYSQEDLELAVLATAFRVRGDDLADDELVIALAQTVVEDAEAGTLSDPRTALGD